MSDTNIPISDEVWKELNSRKERGDTFDDVLRRVLDMNDHKPDLDINPPQTDHAEPTHNAVELPEDIPTTVDNAAARYAIAAAIEYLEREGAATMRDIIEEVMPDHSLGYDVPDLDEGKRYRGSWWRRIVRPGLELDHRIAKPKAGQSKWRYVGNDQN